MKKLLLFSVSLMVAACASAQAPTFDAQSLGGLPTTLAAATQTNFPFATAPVIDCRKQAKVALQITGQLNTLGSNVVFVLAPSIDGIYYATNTGAGVAPANDRLITLTFTNNITRITYLTNIDTAGVGYLKLLSIYNKEGTDTWTNWGVKYGVKISAP